MNRTNPKNLSNDRESLYLFTTSALDGYCSSHGWQGPTPIPSRQLFDWLYDHCGAMEFVHLLALLMGLLGRNVSIVEIPRYVLTREADIPFRKAERAIFHALLDTLIERGQRPEDIARSLDELVSLLAQLYDQIEGKRGHLV